MVATTDVPIIDLASASGDELVAGLQANSCVFITGIPLFTERLAGLLGTARAFFDQPENDKAAVQWDGTGPWQGWQPVYRGGSGAAPMERFELALPDPAHYAGEAEWAATFRQWPADPAEMMATWARYYVGMRELTVQLVTMIAGSLDRPGADLVAWTVGQHSNLCVNHYLAQLEPPPAGQERSRPHTDIGGITLLWGENTSGGLQAQIGPDGEWVPIVFPEASILLQAGDLLHLWSGGSIPANNHRVVNPPRQPGEAPRDRYSVVFFHHPDLDAWVAPPADTAGVSAREHVLARQRRSYQL
jgi:isopenicillin N synthase-like dioxygenase